MAGYVILPFYSSPSPTDIYTNGTRVFRDNSSNVYVGVSNRSLTRLGAFGSTLLFASTSAVATVTIVYSAYGAPSAERYGTYEIGTDNEYNGYYYHEITIPAFSSGEWLSDIVPFSTEQEALSAITYTEPSNPGVNVSFNPVYTGTVNPGVHVSYNPVLANPYGPGGSSSPGGGGGQFDNPTDPIELPELPTHGVTDFIKLWNPSNADMVRLTELLFTGNIFTQAVRDLIGQPISYIVSLGIVPVPLSIGSTATEFYLANQDSGFSMYGVSQQYMRWSCGSVQVPLYWNSFLDFEPHTSIQIFLPFIGFRDLLPSDVVGKTVTVTYHIDVFTGACVAYVANEDTILYQYNGNCLSPIPFAAEQMQNLVSGLVGLLGSAATAAAVLTGGFGAGIAKSILAGSAIGAASSVLSLPEHKAQHGGNAGSTTGLLSSRKPYFVLNRPRQAVAQNQGEYSGYATWYSSEFGQLNGYTQVAECHLHDIPATDWELQEIERLLKEGVFF